MQRRLTFDLFFNNLTDTLYNNILSMHNEILKALTNRYATKIFDTTKKVSEENLHTILESGRLTPSSFGIEAWKFLVVENSDLRTKCRAAGYDQSKITDASHLIVIAGRTDVRENITNELLQRTVTTTGVEVSSLASYKGMVEGAIKNKNDQELDAWIRAQTYIALGMMMETAALLSIDSCPMEGFNPKQIDEILQLSSKNLATTSMLAIGYRGEDPLAKQPKIRRKFDEVIEFIR